MFFSLSIVQETQGSKRISLLASKPPSNANKLKLRIFAADKKATKRNLGHDSDMPSNKNKRTAAQDKKNAVDDDSEFESEEMSDEELDESGNEEVGQAIEEPTMYVHGNGSGADNNCENTMWPDYNDDECNGEFDVGEAIEEEVLYVFGEGNGHDCDIGNNDIKSSETPASSTATSTSQPIVAQSKPMFFFGQAGCLKLSPMKPVVTAETSATSIETEKSQESSSSSIVNESSTNNDTNSIALDAKSECVASENTVNNADETDKGISINNETIATLTNESENNIGDKNDAGTSSKNDSTPLTPLSPVHESTTAIEANIATNDADDDDEQLKVTGSSESSAAIIDNDISKENIESNSSVALANISVQESESIDEESLPTTSTVLQTECHLLSNEKENDIDDSCVDKQSPELRLASDDVKSMEIENDTEIESKLNESCSENVNETNELVNKSELENENQSSVNEIEGETSAEPAIELPTSTNDTIAETNEPSEQVQESSEQIESDITPLAEEQPLAEISLPNESECSNVLDNESNNEVKTDDSPSEQNAIEAEPSENNSPLQEQTSVSTAIEEECKASEISLPEEETPSEIPVELPEQIENTTQELNDTTAAEQPAELIESAAISEEVPSALVGSNDQTQSPAREEIEQPVESIPAEIESVSKVETAVTPLNQIVTDEPKPIAELEPFSNETGNDNEPIPSDVIESTSIVCEAKTIVENESDNNKEAVSIETQPEQSSSQDALESGESVDQIQETIPDLPASVPTIEKRKSIDQIEDASECKKICEEKLVHEELEESADEDATVEEPSTEIPSVSASEPCVPAVECVENNENVGIANADLSAEVPNEPEVSNPTFDESTLCVSNKPELPINSVLESKADVWHETSRVDQAEKQQLPAETDSVPSLVNEALPSISSEKEPVEANLEKREITAPQESIIVESVAVKEQKDEPLPTPSTQTTRSVQLRNRKRRISGEKARHSSESDDNNDAPIESPLSQDSSEEEVGGKRIKMRPKVTTKRTLRKTVEQKRNIKDTDWSSDENEKPNAKRATNDISKQTENILTSCEKLAAADVVENKKASPIVKEEIVTPAVKKEDAPPSPSTIEATEIKAEENQEHQSDEEQATPTRRPGRPARRGRKPGPKPKPKPAAVVEEVKVEEIKEESKDAATEQNETVKEEKSPETKPETRRKKRSLMGLDIAEIETAQANIDETPVRQSRRIAQIKIREEAERRKAEEIALQKMKEASEKKKKGVVTKPSESEEENSESEAKLEKKKRRKKGNKDKPWQTDSDDSSEREEEDVYEHEDVERLPPLGSDHEFSPESDIEDESQIVPTKRARTARKDKTERREEESEEEEDIHACQKCSKSDHPEWILLCDKCDKGKACTHFIVGIFLNIFFIVHRLPLFMFDSGAVRHSRR